MRNPPFQKRKGIRRKLHASMQQGEFGVKKTKYVRKSLDNSGNKLYNDSNGNTAKVRMTVQSMQNLSVVLPINS
jgi:hypothetical protein